MLQLVELLQEKLKEGAVVLAIDGRCGAGKSTLAKELLKDIGGNLIHIDDYFIPAHIQATKTMDATMPNVDDERFIKTILEPLHKKQPMQYASYDCHHQCMKESVELTYTSFTIIEGSYCMHPIFRKYYDYSLFVTVSQEEQLQRLKHRSATLYTRFVEEWIPKEEAYFHQFHIADVCNQVIDTTTKKDTYIERTQVLQK